MGRSGQLCPEAQALARGSSGRTLAPRLCLSSEWRASLTPSVLTPLCTPELPGPEPGSGAITLGPASDRGACVTFRRQSGAPGGRGARRDSDHSQGGDERTRSLRSPARVSSAWIDTHTPLEGLVNMTVCLGPELAHTPPVTLQSPGVGEQTEAPRECNVAQVKRAKPGSVPWTIRLRPCPRGRLESSARSVGNGATGGKAHRCPAHFYQWLGEHCSESLLRAM